MITVELCPYDRLLDSRMLRRRYLEKLEEAFSDDEDTVRIERKKNNAKLCGNQHG